MTAYPSPAFAPATDPSLPLWLTTPETLNDILDELSPSNANWVRSMEFGGVAGSVVVLPNENGDAAGAIGGVGSHLTAARRRFTVATIAKSLPAGNWSIATPLTQADADEAALAWLLAGYSFGTYRNAVGAVAKLVAPKNVDAKRVEAIATGEFITRNLINTPASDMGPADLENSAREVAKQHGAKITVTTGEDLLTNNFPLIHTVGRAAAVAPRLIDMTWGTAGPKVTLVGKGVCFDTGGLNLKPGGSMALMKKDMGGGAAVLGLAHMIMATKTKLRLRVLIPAVENSVSGSSFRPGDILTARNGKTVEINNTDAEGRLVLADALSFAAEDEQDLLISMATLTGAARVAVGPDLAPYFTDHEEVATALNDGAAAVRDPVWRMPFWDPYEAMIEPGIADLDNAPSGGFAGCITAALFLRRFAGSERYVHFDIYGWQPKPEPARPKGGVGQGTRAIFAALPAILKL